MSTLTSRMKSGALAAILTVVAAALSTPAGAGWYDIVGPQVGTAGSSQQSTKTKKPPKVKPTAKTVGSGGMKQNSTNQRQMQRSGGGKR